MRTFYEILGISRIATQEEIIAAYRKRCLETHPDRGGDETAFLNVRKGYEILSDPNKRVEYDKWVKAKEDIEKKLELSVLKKRLEPWIDSFLTQYCQDCDLGTLIMTYFYEVDSIYNNINKTKLNKILTAEIVKNILLIVREANTYKLESVLSLDSICNDILLGRKDIIVSQDVAGKTNVNGDSVKDKNKDIKSKLSNLTDWFILVFAFILVLSCALIYILRDTASNGFGKGSHQLDNVSLLYNGLIKEGYTSDELGDEKTFRNKMSDANNRKKLFEALKQEGYDNFANEKELDEYLGYSNNSEDKRYISQLYDAPENNERNNVNKVIRDANNAIDRALDRYKVIGNGIDTKVNNIGEEHVYKETVFKTGDSPYSDYYGDGGGVDQFDKESLSELKILNYSNSESVVLLETTQGVVIRNVYIKNNSEYTMTNIPEGEYRIKIMYGNSWNSEKDNGYGYPKGGFMKNVSFSKSKDNDLFDFIFKESYEGISCPTYSITLHKVRNGNMQTERISKDDFF